MNQDICPSLRYTVSDCQRYETLYNTSLGKRYREVHLEKDDINLTNDLRYNTKTWFLSGLRLWPSLTGSDNLLFVTGLVQLFLMEFGHCLALSAA